MRIGELAHQSGITAKTLRFYEQSGLLPAPARTPGGYRDYGPECVDRLRFIRRAQAAGLTLREVGEIIGIRESGSAPCGQVVDVLTERLAQVRNQILELTSLEANLETLLDHANRGEPSADDAGVCWILESDLRAADTRGTGIG